MSDVLTRLQAAVGERYGIERELGRGGMATVYLARDLKHERDVAVKVLHPELTAVLGPERFLREIRVAAKLNHPHILPLHDSGRADTFLYYVMPFMEGESLRARLQREGQLSIEEAVQIARQVSSALDYAHRHDIVHRDIKPENVLLQEGEAMVADFGIAIAVHAAAGERITETGLSLGTPEYMSPEQATGERRVDARSDIYSLGVVLFEMLVGETPFAGPSAQAIVAKVLTERPVDVRVARDTVPEPLARIVAKALAKLPADRYASAAELADALGRLVSTVGVAVPPTPRRMPSLRQVLRAVAWRRVLPWAVAAAGVAVGAWSAWRARSAAAPSAVRLDFALPSGLSFVGGTSIPFAVSPQGTHLVYAARSDGRVQLYLRELRSFESRPVAGTDGAIAPFFSPDGEWVGFFADGRLKKVPLQGGAPLTVTDAPWSASWGFAASWGRNDEIVFAPGLSTGLLAVSAAGGRAEALTAPDAAAGELGHGWPQVLDDGRSALFIIAARDGRHIGLLDLESREWSVLIRGGSDVAGARHTPTGHIVYAQAGALVGARVDLRRRTVVGAPRTVLDSVYTFGSGLSYFAVAPSGMLVYSPGGAVPPENRLVWVDSEGSAAPFAVHQGRYLSPQVSPDGRRVVVSIEEGGRRDIWVYERTTGRRNRLTTEAINTDPVWTADGRSITFSSNREGRFHIYQMSAEGTGRAEQVLIREHDQFPHSWSPDGRTLAFYELTPTAGRDVWLMTIAGRDTTLTPVATMPFNERSPKFSPDGRWLAYVSDESGRDEVYVQPFPALDANITVSRDGGKEPVWSADGRRLFYRQGDALMAVSLELGAVFRAGQAVLLFEGRYDVPPMSSGSLNYDVAADGRHFVMVQSDEASVARSLSVVLNWFGELGGLMQIQTR